MKKIALLVVAFFTVATSFSQDQEKPRPKIGLVLSGGGAKGFAHIGVLKVLEQAGIKIDYIGGTSMGAIVGGLYATGYNARQVDSIFKATNFDELINDFIPRSSKNFYEKRNDELYAFTLPFNKFKVGIPTSLSKGMYNYNLLNNLTKTVRHVRDFNKLPIPFLCIGSNIETGEEVILNKGYLAQAMLASAAFPTLFSPVEIDGKLLVDGGVTNNYPIEAVRKMGADIIIGVDVQDDLLDRKKLKGATRILVQITNLQTIEKMKAKIRETDIYIKPDIENYGIISFDDGNKIIQNGEEAAFAVYEKLKALGASKNDFRPGLSIVSDSLQINRIVINPLHYYTNSYIIGKLRFKQNSKISYEDLRRGIDNITATQNFAAISYTLEKNGNQDDLVLNLTENPTTMFLKFGLHYDGLYKSGILINLTKKKTVVKNDIMSLDVVLGDNIRYNLDYYIDNGFYWSFGIKSRLNKFNRNVATDFNNGELIKQLGIETINLDFSDFSNQVYAQTLFVQKFLLGAGAELKFLKIKSKTTENTMPVFENSNYVSLFGYLKYDSLDNKYFPKTGWYLSSDAQYYVFSSDYTKEFNKFSVIKGDVGFAKLLFKKVTVNVQSEAGFAVGMKSVPFFNFVLGGYGFSTVNNFRHFYGYDYLSISADSFIKSTVTFDYEFLKKNHLNLSANYANIEDNLFASTRWIASPKYSGYALGYGLETIIGPIQFKYTWSPETGKGFAWFNVGFWF
ncbi:patatin-like phospholipase family protein [Flavobacterium psychrotolerans]|uniref:Patatin n=1 Tax=Flavobacterium psychrotolerans TaxID=2169410 RepID=A0A2U1JGN7_9FLAO|nr:patatin-like phospholipase family protein [Flavobacterium psychrotolerans]PWA04291.1 patatin [Flavobacterium psychrotolerans]